MRAFRSPCTTAATTSGCRTAWNSASIARRTPRSGWFFAALVNAERLYAVDLGVADQAAFKADMTAAAGHAGIPLTLHDRGDDKWMQDCMEFGRHRAPHAAFRVVLRGAGTPSA